MKLSPRLEYILSLAESSAHTADVGTDHGKLAAELIISGKASHVTACDINEGPLSKAAELVSELGIGESVSIVCTDGLRGLECRGIDQVVIAGMGGELIRDIISAAPWVKTDAVRLLLQPMTASAELIRYLYDEGFAIETRGAVREGRRAYEVISAKFDGVRRECTPFTAEAGEFDGDADAVRALLQKKRAALSKRLIGAKRSSADEAEMILSVIAEIDKRLEEK